MAQGTPQGTELFEIIHSTRAMRRLKPDPVPDDLHPFIGLLFCKLQHRRSWPSFNGSIYRSERQHVDADTRKAASMKLRREARTLKGRALCSLRRAVTAFNSCDDDGRVTCVLLHMQHAAEILLKVILVQHRIRVFDPKKQRSLGFEKWIKRAIECAKLTPQEAGLLRAIDALRDAEQHWQLRRRERVIVPESGHRLSRDADGSVSEKFSLVSRRWLAGCYNHVDGCPSGSVARSVRSSSVV